MKVINKFRGYNAYLSNFYNCKLMYQGRKYTCVENFFQAMKCENIEDMVKFKGLNGAESKRLGRRIKMRSDWNKIRVDVMYLALKLKFSQNEDLRIKLKGTIGYELIEGNNHGDTFWGVCNGVGENMLGKLLMKVRSEL